jgi:phospholipase/carboxylesterase
MPASKPDWRTNRPLEGFYTSHLPGRPDAPVRTFLPTDYQPKYPYPLVVVLHGEGSGEEQAARLAPQLSRRNYVCVGLRGTANVGPRADGRTAFGWGGTDAALADYLRAAIDHTRRTYTIHPGRVYLLGVCEGADVAYRAGLRMTDRVAGVVALNGRLSVRPARLCGVRVFVGHGSSNPVVPHALAQRDAGRLAAAGADVRFNSYATTHKIHADMLRDVNRWIMAGITADADAPMKD